MPLDLQSPHVAVVGGGITGLAAAHRLLERSEQESRPVRITLFESGGRIGGLFGSERIGEYLIELGADSFITEKPAAVALCERLGIELIPTEARYRRSLILHRGRPLPTPEGFNLLAPTRIWPILTTPLLSWRGKLRIACEVFVPPASRTPQRSEQLSHAPRESSPSNDESLASFVRRRFGREALERIVQPMVGGIYTADPERLSLAATLPRFLEMERRYGSLIRALKRRSASRPSEESASGARYGLFAAPRQGMQSLLDALQGKLSGRVDLRLNTPVSAINRDPASGRFHVATAAGTESFRSVIVTLPAYRAAELMTGWDAKLSSALNQIEYASSAIVVSGHRLADVEHPCDAFGLVVPRCERRRILAVSFLSRKFPSRSPENRIVLRTFVGGAMQPEEIDCSDDELVGKVLSELKDVLGVRGEPDFVRPVRYNRAMPQYTVGHLQRVAEIQSLEGRTAGLHLAGNAYQGVGIPDAIASGEKAAGRAWEELFSEPEKGTPLA